MIIPEDLYLKHYGIIRRSGRYPWGSGKNPHQRAATLLQTITYLRSQGLNDNEIIKSLNLELDGELMKSTQFRDLITIAKNEKRAGDIALAVRLKNKGMANKAIAERLGLSGESQVRSLLKDSTQARVDILKSTASMLKDQVDSKGYIDIGTGVENYLKISPEKLRAAVMMLKDEGYVTHTVLTEQLGTAGNMTKRLVVAPPGTEYLDVKLNPERIHLPDVVSMDGGRTYSGDAFQTPISVDSKRIDIRYADQGGTDADGVVYIRPGVEDLSLGGKNYAQVRIAVDGTHYIKGMAMFKDDLPPGVDLQFNTNKNNTGNKLDALKRIDTSSEDAPFGALIRKQIGERDANGNLTKVTSAMNIVNEEGNWDMWSKNLSSQTLSKQSDSLARTQLDLKYENSREEFREIMSLTNPVLKRKMLDSFANSTDSSAVHLEAATIPGSSWHVILPFNSLSDREIYAPNFDNGERVALIRYPHGGTFEIPELVVNNRHAPAKNVIGQSRDAVGINAKVAARLSGADFDGDTVMVIPNNAGRVKSTSALEGLKNFDPQSSYPPYDGMPTIDGGRWSTETRSVVYPPGNKKPTSKKQSEMGKVSNLITDMTIQGANTSELARAVRHSMVVIDAEKHSLNYKESARANGIPQLKEKYQGGANKGAATLISRATSEARVPERKMSYTIDRATGVKTYNETGRTYVNAKGKTIERTTTVDRLSTTPDAHSLSSGTKIESIYANHSNRMKALANEARREMVHVPSIPPNPSARQVYAPQLASLDRKLDTALRNAPLERQAQTLANIAMAQKKDANPNMDNATLKRERHRTLKEMRIRTGAGKQLIEIDDKEWEAIQSGAISNSKLTKIVNNTDLDELKKRAMPNNAPTMSAARIARVKSMIAQGYTQAEVAEALGISTSTVKNVIS